MTAAQSRILVRAAIEEGIIRRGLLRLQRQFCGDRSVARRWFPRGRDGVNAVTVENGGVAVEFDERTIADEQVRRLSRESIEKLGDRVGED